MFTLSIGKLFVMSKVHILISKHKHLSIHKTHNSWKTHRPVSRESSSSYSVMSWLKSRCGVHGSVQETLYMFNLRHSVHVQFDNVCVLFQTVYMFNPRLYVCSVQDTVYLYIPRHNLYVHSKTQCICLFQDTVCMCLV